MAEIALALDSDFEKPRPPSGFPVMGAGQAQAYARWWRSLTPRQRLDAIRRGEV